jgi:copper chaperone CopZ
MIAALAAAATCWAVAAQAQEPVKKADNLVEVTVTGAGLTKEDADRDAQRKAVEKGAGTFIHSQSEVKDFTLIRDTILTKAAGFIKSKKVLSEKQMEDGTWEVKLSAEVSIQGIEDTWGTVKNLLQAMGRPKIMVFINETIDKERVEVSTVQTAIEEQLLKAGFLLVDQKQLKEIDKKDLTAAVAEDSPAKVQAIAKRFGAQVFMTGAATANAGEKKSLYGVTHFTYEGEANVKTFSTDTAQLISSIPGVPQRGVQQVARSAAKQALDAEGKVIAPKVTFNILDHWMEILQGRGEMKLEIENVKFAQVDEIEQALKKIPGIKDVNSDFHNNVAEMSMQCDANAKDLAKKIAKALPKLEITDVTQNVIKAKYKAE